MKLETRFLPAYSADLPFSNNDEICLKTFFVGLAGGKFWPFHLGFFNAGWTDITIILSKSTPSNSIFGLF